MPLSRSYGGAPKSIRSIDRAFRVLEAIANAKGAVGLTQLSTECQIPMPTTYRVAHTLAELGYVRQEASRKYALGSRLMSLVDSSTKWLETLAHPHMEALVSVLGESVNLAVLDGDEVVYVAQAQPSANFMRMFTEVGRRTSPHCTAVGKAMLADLGNAEVTGLLTRRGLEKRTARTITSLNEFLSDLDRIRACGYAVDDGEQELGVRCVAVSIAGAPRAMAISVSGPTPRMPNECIARAVPKLHHVADQIAAEFSTAESAAPRNT